jgi:hypothetical protein
MVQTISSIFLLYINATVSLLTEKIRGNLTKIYLPLIQPFTANAPIRRLDVYIEYSTLGLINPLKFTEDNPL